MNKDEFVKAEAERMLKKIEENFTALLSEVPDTSISVYHHAAPNPVNPYTLRIMRSGRDKSFGGEVLDQHISLGVRYDDEGNWVVEHPERGEIGIHPTIDAAFDAMWTYWKGMDDA